MLVVTRRPGEAVLIGDSIELHIVDVDGRHLETRCAISIVDENGDDQQLTCKTRPDGIARVARIEN
jgi:hypothetical protein